MNITRENTSQLSATINVNIEKADYEKAVNQSLKDLRKKANMPGFRPGMVPKGLIVKMYGKSVMAEEINKILSKSLYDYIEAEKLDLLGQPLESEKNEDIDFEAQEDFTFKFDIGLAPQVNIAIDNTLEVPYYPIKETDTSVVDKAVEDLRKRFGETESPETIEEGCDISAKFIQLDADGKLLEGGIAAENAFFNLNDIQLKTILKKLTGLKAGEKCVFDPMRAIKDADKVARILSVTKEMVEDLKAEFEVEILSFSKNIPAELNEELYKKAYPKEDIKTEEALREQLEAERQKAYDVESDKLMLNQAVDVMINKAEMALPNDFLKRWILHTSEGKMTEEQLDAQYDSYAKSVKWQVLQKFLVTTYNIKVETKEAEDFMRKSIVQQYFGGMEENEQLAGMLDGIVQESMKNEKQMEGVYNQLFDTKLMALLKEKVKLKKHKAVSIDKFIEKSNEIMAAV